MNYVLGFRFREAPTGKQVALIRKTKPTWQAGKLNGIGGKVEIGEGFRTAMAREFYEETGVMTDPGDWRGFGVLNHNGHLVYLFESTGHPDEQLQQTTEEEPGWFYADALAYHVSAGSISIMPNLAWMIPLALDKDRVTADITDHSPVPA